MSHTRTNWHEAITCAIQIDLIDYAHLLEYKTEHFLSQNLNRIDLLVIQKNTDIQIPKNIAALFRKHNIFEYKGLGSSLSKKAYYKTNGHAGYYIDSFDSDCPDRRDITLTFPTFHYPRNLFRHLTKECRKAIANPFPGVYYIENEMYPTQVLVISELSPEDSLYLYCLSQNLSNLNVVNDLSLDYQKNKNNRLHTAYMNQFFYSHMKGEQFMVCEGLLNYFGTSSEEIAQKAREQEKQIYQPQIDKLTEDNRFLLSENSVLKQLLLEHNISY